MEFKKITKVAYYGLGQSNTYVAFAKHIVSEGYFECGDDKYIFRNAANECFQLFGCLNEEKINDLLSSGEVDYALVPIINSDSGVVTFTSKMIFDKAYEIAKILKNKITLYMYSLKEIKDLRSVKRIYSNMAALSQCSEFINLYMPFATFIKTYSTTEAAERMAENEDYDSVCISNNCIEMNENITHQLFKVKNPLNADGIVSNGGGSTTKFFLLKKRTEKVVPNENIYKMLKGYYIYQSERQGDSISSVSPAAFRFVEIKENNEKIDIHGYVYNSKCEALFSTNCTALSVDGDHCHFFYSYNNQHETKTVNGLVCIDIFLPTFMNTGEMSGKYCGYCNNKSGIIKYKKISKQEFELLISGD